MLHGKEYLCAFPITLFLQFSQLYKILAFLLHNITMTVRDGRRWAFTPRLPAGSMPMANIGFETDAESAWPEAAVMFDPSIGGFERAELSRTTEP